MHPAPPAQESPPAAPSSGQALEPARAIERAERLFKLATNINDMHPSLPCFMVARLLREEGNACQVFSQVLCVESADTFAAEHIVNQVFLVLHGAVLDPQGTYPDIEHLVLDRSAKWNRLVRSDGFPRAHHPEAEDYDWQCPCCVLVKPTHSPNLEAFLPPVTSPRLPSP